MNRENPLSASAGGGTAMPFVPLSPRPASDPGDGNSDLGSDAGWHYKMGSDSDADDDEDGGDADAAMLGDEEEDRQDEVPPPQLPPPPLPGSNRRGSGAVAAASCVHDEDNMRPVPAPADRDDDDAGMISFIRGYRGVTRAQPEKAPVPAADAATNTMTSGRRSAAHEREALPSAAATALGGLPPAGFAPRANVSRQLAESLSSFDSSRPTSPVSSAPAQSSGTGFGQPVQGHSMATRAAPAVFSRNNVATKSVSFANNSVESPMTASGSDDPNTSASTPKSASTATNAGSSSTASRRTSLRSRVARAGAARRNSHAGGELHASSPSAAGSSNPFLTNDPNVPQREPPLSLRGRQIPGARTRRELPPEPRHSRTYSAESWSRLTSGPSNSSNSSFISVEAPAAASRPGRQYSTSAPTTPQWTRFASPASDSALAPASFVPSAVGTQPLVGATVPALYTQLPMVAAINLPAPAEATYYSATPAMASGAILAGAATASHSTMISAGSSQGFLSPSPASCDMTFLECVVDLLRGTSCLKRRNVVWALDSQLWLTPDMSTVKFRTVTRKGPVTDEFLVSKVRKIRATERDIVVTVDGKNKAVEFIFPTREKTNIWLSGLCCLVPARATVKSRYKFLEQRENYDPLQDSWEGKPLSSRKRFNEYILLGTIGRGAFSKVKLALSTENRQFYAVKVLCKSMMRKQNRNAVFERTSQDVRRTSGLGNGEVEPFSFADVSEIAILQKLDHPNVVKMRSIFDDVENDRLYIVVEFVACGPVMSSSRLTGAQPLREERVREIFLDVFAGLQYLHYNGIVHRDIKPDNLLKAGDQSVKISDFGAAKMYEELPERQGEDDNAMHNFRTTVGTPAFTAPELCLSEKSPPAPAQSFPADIWSLGATLYYMLYGRAPYFAKSVFEMYDAICTQPLEFPDMPRTSRHVRDVMSDMMERLPEKRATFERILCSPWLQEDPELRDRVAELIQVAKHHERESHTSRDEDGIHARVKECWARPTPENTTAQRTVRSTQRQRGAVGD